MRWNEPKSGDIKTKKKFAILPIEANGEVRWLEQVVVKYQFFDNQVVKYKGKFYRVIGWLPIEFIDN